MNDFVMLSNGTDVIFKNGNQSYKFTSCFVSNFSVDCYGNSGVNISIDLVASECEVNPSDSTIINVLEETKLKFGQVISRKLDI